MAAESQDTNKTSVPHPLSCFQPSMWHNLESFHVASTKRLANSVWPLFMGDYTDWRRMWDKPTLGRSITKQVGLSYIRMLAEQDPGWHGEESQEPLFIQSFCLRSCFALSQWLIWECKWTKFYPFPNCFSSWYYHSNKDQPRTSFMDHCSRERKNIGVRGRRRGMET